MNFLIKNRVLLFGFILGFLAASLLNWILSLAGPILLTNHQKESYVIGLQYGNVLQRYPDDFDYKIVAQGLRDGKNKTEALSDEEVVKIRGDLRERSRGQRARAEGASAPNSNPGMNIGSVDSEGFMLMPRGFKVKIENSQKTFQELRSRRSRIESYQLDIVLELQTTGQAAQVLGQLKNQKFDRRSIPRVAGEIYQLLEKGQVATAKELDQRFLQEIYSALQIKEPTQTGGAVVLKIKRLQE